MFMFYFPDPHRRSCYLPWYCKNVLNCSLRYGQVYTTTDISGVIFALSPIHTRITIWEYSKSGFFLTLFLLGFINYKHSMDCERFVANTQERIMKKRPHYYLWGLAVDPKEQVTGIGTALLSTVLTKADVQQIPVYLETHDENNVLYYQKHGFSLIETTQIPKYELQIWCREPI
ncbi:MAG: GNAT family N-acetyltransferase [Spirochaetia bacterium]|nr:GNAT family N-acetyltransferase [Spirochaetia bacterium]